jgi:lysophospholipase L1-like esterase
MQRFLPRAVVVLLSLIAALGLAEWAVRTFSPQITGEVVFAYHPDLGAIPVPYQRGRKTSPHGVGYDFSHNSQGFRGNREYGPDKGQAIRILFVGDSFTYGVGVDDAQAIPRQVEEILRARNYTVEIINAGNPGKGKDYALRLLQVMGPQLKPDLVALCFFWNDYLDNADGEYFRLGENEELIPEKPRSLTAKKARIENLPGINWLLSRSHAANLVRAGIVNLLRPSGRIQHGKKYNPREVTFNPQLTGIFLKQVIAAVPGLGSDILFFYLPEEQEVNYYRKSGDTTSYEKSFFNLLKFQKKGVYSLTKPLSAIPGELEVPYWGHYNPRATLEVARYISGPMEEWLKTRQSRTGAGRP